MEDDRVERTAPLTYASVMLVLLGAINVLHGYTAWRESDWFLDRVLLVDLETWGVLFMAWGVVQVVAGVLVMRLSSTGVKLGIVVTMVSMALWFLLTLASPHAALAGLAISASVFWSLMRDPRATAPSR
jgi:hypothetical protein